MKNEYYYLGHITKPFGIKGQLCCYFDTDEPEKYVNLDAVFIDLDGERLPYLIRERDGAGRRGGDEHAGHFHFLSPFLFFEDSRRQILLRRGRELLLSEDELVFDLRQGDALAFRGKVNHVFEADPPLVGIVEPRLVGDDDPRFERRGGPGTQAGEFVDVQPDAVAETVEKSVVAVLIVPRGKAVFFCCSCCR